MKLNRYYFKEFRESYKKTFDTEPSYNDETGIWTFLDINTQIKAWNYKMEPCGDFNSINFENLIKIVSACPSYWFDDSEENDE